MSTALLLSGGLDSTALAFWTRPDLVITLDYGQVPAEGEIRAASAVAASLGIEHEVLRFPMLRTLGTGDLAGTARSPSSPHQEWWPYRNQLLVTLAAATALRRGLARLLLGTVASDGHHADGRPEFVAALDALMRLQEGGLSVQAPGIGHTSLGLIRASGVSMSLLGWSHSCHVANHACGECGGCRKHYRTMEALGEPPH